MTVGFVSRLFILKSWKKEAKIYHKNTDFLLKVESLYVYISLLTNLGLKIGLTVIEFADACLCNTTISSSLYLSVSLFFFSQRFSSCNKISATEFGQQSIERWPTSTCIRNRNASYALFPSSVNRISYVCKCEITVFMHLNANLPTCPVQKCEADG